MEEDYEQDRYDDYDEYEEVEGSEAEEEEEEYEEEPAPTKEELEFLKLREKLKEEFRQKLKKQTGSASDRPSQPQNTNRPIANDKFGSFFGPSKPVIAPRVLEESRSILETRHAAARAAPSSDSGNKKGVPKASVSGQQQQNVNEVSKVASKAKVLKEMRDYSFLLSDDAEFPGSVKEEPAPQKAAAPSSGNAVRPAAGNARQVPRNVPGQSSASNPARLVAKGHQNSASASQNSASASQRPQSSKVVARKVGNATTGAGRPVEREALRQNISAPGAGGTRPPVKVMNGSSGVKKPLPAKLNPSNQAQSSEQRRAGQGQDRIKAAPRPSLPSSRNQLVKPSSARNAHEERLKKRTLSRDDDDDDPDDIRQQIRSIFGYNPHKYRHLDSMDDRDMEVGFDSIMREEKRSLRIAREEDAEQLRLIEEEEKRERMRKKQKQKLSRK